MRKLTKFFGSFKIAKYQKENKCSLMEMIEFDNMDINALTKLIKLGHPDTVNSQGNKQSMTDEEAADILDRYLAADENNNYVTAYLDILNEMDADIHLFRGFGIKMSDLKAKLQSQIDTAKAVLEDTEKPVVETVN